MNRVCYILTVRYILFLFSFVTAFAFAQDTETTTQSNPRWIEEVVVIGSRARIESQANELPVAVDILQGLDLERTGEIDLNVSLSKLAPSFNYSRTSVGDGALFNPATLRGLSPDQTLVLVNGKRRHNMAWLRVLDGNIGYGTGGTDLRAIPTAALSRVEVLRDGAAAQYGSDAIAGVINLVLQESTDGGELTLHGGTGNADGSRLGATFNGGYSLGSDGFLNVTGEWYEVDALLRNGGNGGLDPNFQDELITDSSPAHNGSSFFLNAGYSVSDTAELYAFGGLSHREGRASGAYRFRYNYWEGLESGDDTWNFVVPNFINFHERNSHPVYPNGFLPYEESRIDDVSVVVGWRDTISDWDYDLSTAYGHNEFGFDVSNSINASIGANFLHHNPHASVAQIVASSGPTSGNSGSVEFNQITINFDVRRTFEDSVLTAMAAGIEYRTESYRQNAGDEASWSCGLPHSEEYGAFAVGPDGTPLDGTVAACGFQGYPGYSPRNARLSDDNRDSQAAYLELELQPMDAFTISSALRTENYSDAGTQTTGMLAARLQVSSLLALRGSMSTGFRAPSLSQRRFNSILFIGGETGLTTIFAANEGHPITRFFGVNSLEHETSGNFSAGVVMSTVNFDLSLDAYRTDIEDRVVRSLGIGCAGVAACDAERVAQVAFFFNGVDTETRGADLSLRWGTPVAGGQLWLSGNFSVNKTEITNSKLPAGAPSGLSSSDYFGGWTADLLQHGQPRRQANMTADWDHNTYGALLRANYYGVTTQHPLDTGMIKISAATTLDLETWFTAGVMRGALGVNNISNELPTALPKTHLSNILWGIRYPTNTPFGLVGRFTYIRLSFDFPW